MDVSVVASIGNAKGMFYYLEATHNLMIVFVEAILEIDLNALTKQNWSTISYGGAFVNNPADALPPKEFCSKMQTIVDSDYADTLLDQWSKLVISHTCILPLFVGFGEAS